LPAHDDHYECDAHANIDCTADTTDNALIIGAAGITVDLNGYSILGPATPPARWV